MVAVTYGVARVVRAKPAAQAIRARSRRAAQRLFARFIDALIEARMQQAQREIRMHMHCCPTVSTSAATAWSRPVPATCRSAAGNVKFSPAKPPRSPRPGRFCFQLARSTIISAEMDFMRELRLYRRNLMVAPSCMAAIAEDRTDESLSVRVFPRTFLNGIARPCGNDRCIRQPRRFHRPIRRPLGMARAARRARAHCRPLPVGLLGSSRFTFRVTKAASAARRAFGYHLAHDPQTMSDAMRSLITAHQACGSTRMEGSRSNSFPCGPLTAIVFATNAERTALRSNTSVTQPSSRMRRSSAKPCAR